MQQHNNHIDGCSQTGQSAQIRSKTQGSGGVADDTIDGVVQQFPEAPLGGTGVTLAGGVGDIAGVVTDPCENTLGETVILRKLHDTVSNTAPECAEIAGITLQLYTGQPIDEVVEALLEEGQYLAFTTAILVGCYHIILFLFVQDLDHVPDDFWPLLQIGVNEGNVFTVRLLHTGINTGLLAKIPGEGNNLHRTPLCFVQLSEVVQGRIFAAVIYKNDFVVIAAAFEGPHHRILKSGNIFSLIIAGYHKG